MVAERACIEIQVSTKIPLPSGKLDNHYTSFKMNSKLWFGVNQNQYDAFFPYARHIHTGNRNDHDQSNKYQTNIFFMHSHVMMPLMTKET
jgi:hypothetical protein